MMLEHCEFRKKVIKLDKFDIDLVLLCVIDFMQPCRGSAAGVDKGAKHSLCL